MSWVLGDEQGCDTHADKVRHLFSISYNYDRAHERYNTCSDGVYFEDLNLRNVDDSVDIWIGGWLSLKNNAIYETEQEFLFHEPEYSEFSNGSEPPGNFWTNGSGVEAPDAAEFTILNDPLTRSPINTHPAIQVSLHSSSQSFPTFNQPLFDVAGQQDGTLKNAPQEHASDIMTGAWTDRQQAHDMPLMASSTEPIISSPSAFNQPASTLEIPSALRTQTLPRAVHFKCSKCPRNFATESRLLVHERKHAPRPVCSTCGQDFADARTLERHSQSKHAGRGSYQQLTSSDEALQPFRIVSNDIVDTFVEIAP
ncbi:hypothetical protein EV356DRAFT_566800 [Viridothelium virens]|uniref:C2H2-type domain-containing protein n=1 Tax=Viridothelium virens TaxID=1048519 RepID=A0A6A6HA39_VIRVR|nr:hypothetical protein EV356DRAFT_566800 [Viridothelium virens]